MVAEGEEVVVADVVDQYYHFVNYDDPMDNADVVGIDAMVLRVLNIDENEVVLEQIVVQKRMKKKKMEEVEEVEAEQLHADYAVDDDDVLAGNSFVVDNKVVDVVGNKFEMLLLGLVHNKMNSNHFDILVYYNQPMMVVTMDVVLHHCDAYHNNSNVVGNDEYYYDEYDCCYYVTQVVEVVVDDH